MDTQTLNLNPDTGNDNSEKTEKMKKAAVKGGKFAAAAAVGVAGTMTAEAIIHDKEDVVVDDPTPAPGPTPTPVNPQPEKPAEEVIAGEPVTDFDPNDIVIEVDEVEETVEGTDENPEVDVEDNNQEVAELEPQPITGEDEPIEVLEDDVMIAQVEPEEIDPQEIDPAEMECMYGGPEGWDETDDPTEWIAEDDVAEDPDILDDIMNA